MTNDGDMLTDATLKALIEAIIYVAPEPVTLDTLAKALEGEERERVKARLEELIEDFERADHGIQALETLAVIAYRQPVTLPEIQEIRGVDSGGVIHTLMEKKLVVTAGRKSVVGRPILYRTSRDFLVHFGLKDTSELPSLREFEELARQALGSELALAEPAPSSDASGPSEELSH